MLAKIFRYLKSRLLSKVWKDIEYFRPEWKNRIKEMASYIGEETSVLDLGCGSMWLKDFLPESVTYYGCDYKSRGPDVLVCDFNKHEFPDIEVDVCFASGVLEYVEDVEWFLNRVSQVSGKLLLSYCTVDDYPDRSFRKKLCWVNHLSEDELVNLAKTCHLELCSRHQGVDGNAIFEFIRANSANLQGNGENQREE